MSQGQFNVCTTSFTEQIKVRPHVVRTARHLRRPGGVGIAVRTATPKTSQSARRCVSSPNNATSPRRRRPDFHGDPLCSSRPEPNPKQRTCNSHTAASAKQQGPTHKQRVLAQTRSSGGGHRERTCVTSSPTAEATTVPTHTKASRWNPSSSEQSSTAWSRADPLR